MRNKRMFKIVGAAFVFAILFAATMSQAASIKTAAGDSQVYIPLTPREVFLLEPETEDLVAEIYEPDKIEIDALARMLYGEARGVSSTMEKAACVWCVLNRVDDPRFPNTVLEVLEAPHQFVGYKKTHPVLPELAKLAADVLTRHHAEQAGQIEAGRVLPPEYVFFTGDGKRNRFRPNWKGANFYNWTLSNPYCN